MIVAVVGKGGVGKTTVTALLLRRLLDGKETPVLAIDADPSSCLGAALGIPVERTLAEEREALRDGEGRPPSMSQADWLALKTEELLVEREGFDLLTMGRPEGPGCYCFANNLIRGNLDRLGRAYRHVLLDCEAGLEHLSRRTSGRPDALVCVASRARMAAETIARALAIYRELTRLAAPARRPGAERLRTRRALGAGDDTDRRRRERHVPRRDHGPTGCARGRVRTRRPLAARSRPAGTRRLGARGLGFAVKVAVTGKGGVGKTTVAASLARALRGLGHEVVAVDADPDTNLAGCLGYRGPEIAPLAQWKALVAERVGGSEGWGGFLRMNPKVDDIPEQCGVVVDGIRLLVMGTIERGRRGCACPESVLLREVLGHLVLETGQDLVVDMEAGIEHLGRATAEGVDIMLVVVEPGWAALQTASRVARLARDLGIRSLGVVANRVASDVERDFVRSGVGQLPLVGVLPVDPGLEREARAGAYQKDRPFHREMARIAATIGSAREGSL